MAKLRSWTDEELIRLVKETFSIRAVIIGLGLVPAGGNYLQVRAKIIELNLSTNHFKGERWNTGIKYHTKTRPEISVLLNQGSVVQSYKLKLRLYELGLKIPKCELCGWEQQSDDVRIPVELDHINGVHNDNRIENLRILCPNCHSLQSTHRGKNK